MKEEFSLFPKKVVCKAEFSNSDGTVSLLRPQTSSGFSLLLPLPGGLAFSVFMTAKLLSEMGLQPEKVTRLLLLIPSVLTPLSFSPGIGMMLDKGWEH